MLARYRAMGGSVVVHCMGFGWDLAVVDDGTGPRVLKQRSGGYRKTMSVALGSALPPKSQT